MVARNYFFINDSLVTPKKDEERFDHEIFFWLTPSGGIL